VSPLRCGSSICILYHSLKVFTRNAENNVRDQNIFNVFSVSMRNINYKF
jgi:hypothetical protein